MCSLDLAMSPKISIICESDRHEIGHSVREKLENIGYVTEIQWQEDKGLKTSFYNAAAVVACVTTTNSNNLHLVSEIERAAYAQIPIIAVLIDQDFDPNDQGWLSIIQMIKARAVVDFSRANEFELYFEDLYKQWTRNVPEKERVEKGTDVKDEDFQGDEKETDDNECNEDKEDNWKDGREAETLNQKENEDESNNEREAEKEDVTTVNSPGEDEHQRDDEDIEKGEKEGEETEEVGTKEYDGEKQDEKDAEKEELKNTDASNTEDTFPNEDITADGSTAPNDETIPPNEDTVQESVPGEDTTGEGGFAHEEGVTTDKDISSADGSVPEEVVTLVEPTGHDATTGWNNPGNENFTHFNSSTEFKGSGKETKRFNQSEQEEKLKGDVFSVEEGEPYFGENAAA